MSVCHVPTTGTSRSFCSVQLLWATCCESAADVVLFTAGMLDLKHAQEWVVTTKLGSSDKRPGTQMPVVPVRTCRFYAAEVMFSFFVLASASYGIFSVNKWSFSIFLTLQGMLPAGALLTSIACWEPMEAACFKRHMYLSVQFCTKHACCDSIPELSQLLLPLQCTQRVWHVLHIHYVSPCLLLS